MQHETCAKYARDHPSMAQGSMPQRHLTCKFHLHVCVLQSLLLPVLLPLSAVASVAGLTCKCLESGSVLVVRTDETSSWHQSAWPYIALDKGIKMKDER